MNQPLAFVLIFFVFFSCKKDDDPVDEIPESNFFTYAGEYYETPNAYILPVDTFYTYSIQNIIFTDGELDTTDGNILNTKQLIYLDINLALNDKALQGDFNLINDGREAQTFSSCKINLYEKGKQYSTKSGVFTFTPTDTTIQVVYNLILEDNSIISGNFEGNIEKHVIQLNKKVLHIDWQ